MPLSIVVDNPDQDSGHLPTDPFAGLVGNLKSLQARSMKMSAQLFVTPRCLPMVELLTIGGIHEKIDFLNSSQNRYFFFVYASAAIYKNYKGAGYYRPKI